MTTQVWYKELANMTYHTAVSEKYTGCIADRLLYTRFICETHLRLYYFRAASGMRCKMRQRKDLGFGQFTSSLFSYP